jgi:hypothetical protein
MGKKKRRLQKPKSKRRSLVEGMARCTFNDKMEDDLEVGGVYYVREIPNMRGHCVVLSNGKMPLIGYHLERFELLDEDEV